MQVRFSFKHMKTSESILSYAESKITPKIEKFSTKPIECHLTFSVEGHPKIQITHCSIKGGDGFNFQVEASCEDMYGSIDLLADKLEAQLKKQKEKLKRHKFNDNIKNLRLVDYVSKDDCDSIPVDANDMIKYEEARLRSFG